MINIEAMRKLVSAKQEFPKRFVKQMLEEIISLRRDIQLQGKRIQELCQSK